MTLLEYILNYMRGRKRERGRGRERNKEEKRRRVSHITQNCIISRKTFPMLNWAYHIQMMIILLNKQQSNEVMMTFGIMCEQYTTITIKGI